MASEQEIQIVNFRVRLLWVAMLFGQVVFLSVVVFLILQGLEPGVTDASTLQNLLYLSGGVLIVGGLVGYFLRMQIYKAGWQADCVKPDMYFMGNLISYALLETISLVALVTVLLSTHIVPFVIPAVVALVLMLINYPNGNPMRPAPIGNLM